jgi:hypothetical protein
MWVVVFPSCVSSLIMPVYCTPVGKLLSHLTNALGLLITPVLDSLGSELLPCLTVF